MSGDAVSGDAVSGDAVSGDAGLTGTHPGDQWDRLLEDLASQPREEGWVTLEEAVAASGVSRSTLRSWYRSGRIPSRMVSGVHGPQRVVPLTVVVDQALASPRSRRQLEHARSVQAEVEALRQRVSRIERHLGLD